MQLKLMSYFHFNACTSWNEGSLLDEGSHDAKSIMERTVSFIKYELVRSTKKY